MKEHKRYVGVLVKVGDKCLLCKRNKKGSFPGMWSVPAGKIEDGEGTRSAAVREFKEETDLDINPDLLKFNGMLFFMDDDTSCFWMKNCIIPLDIIFIEGRTITKIHHDCPPCKSDDCPNYCGKGRMILEIMGGSAKELDIKKGDQIKFLVD